MNSCVFVRIDQSTFQEKFLPASKIWVSCQKNSRYNSKIYYSTIDREIFATLIFSTLNFCHLPTMYIII